MFKDESLSINTLHCRPSLQSKLIRLIVLLESHLLGYCACVCRCVNVFQIRKLQIECKSQLNVQQLR